MKINIDTNKISNLTYRVNEDISLNISFANNEMTIEDISKIEKPSIDEAKFKQIKDTFNYCLNYKKTDKNANLMYPINFEKIKEDIKLTDNLLHKISNATTHHE